MNTDAEIAKLQAQAHRRQDARRRSLIAAALTALLLATGGAGYAEFHGSPATAASGATQTTASIAPTASVGQVSPAAPLRSATS
ncbi:unannotated protein [freshwater metagenome]|uniref:Unannotated protein n=1 Tax=freshwater metagenome TaxID=449393 RepID=A0A6J7D9G3_9ZZZZ|nr:hypothetical protein [Actinomycetota bacterium]